MGTKLMSESYCLSHRVCTHPGANLGTGPDISMQHGNGGNEESPFPASSTSDRSETEKQLGIGVRAKCQGTKKLRQDIKQSVSNDHGRNFKIT